MAIFILTQVKITLQERGSVSVLGSEMDGLDAAVIPCSARRSRTGRDRLPFLFLRVESSPSAASFQDVARTIHYGVEVEVGHSMYSERHARYAVGDDLVLLRVADPCHAEVGHRKYHRTPLATLLHNAHFVRGICHRLDLAVLEQAHIFKPVGLFDVSDGLLDSPSRHVALHHLPEGIARGALREGRQQHHRLLPEPLDDDHVQQSVRDVWKAHRHDAELDGDTSLSAVVVELDDFPVPHRMINVSLRTFFAPSSAMASCRFSSSPFAESIRLSLSSTFLGWLCPSAPVRWTRA